MTMTFRCAVLQMAQNDVSDAAIQAIYDAVEPLCKTETDGHGGETTTLWEWLSQTGGYHGDETPASIAAEWDNLAHYS